MRLSHEAASSRTCGAPGARRVTFEPTRFATTDACTAAGRGLFGPGRHVQCRLPPPCGAAPRSPARTVGRSPFWRTIRGSRDRAERPRRLTCPRSGRSRSRRARLRWWQRPPRALWQANPSTSKLRARIQRTVDQLSTGLGPASLPGMARRASARSGPTHVTGPPPPTRDRRSRGPPGLAGWTTHRSARPCAPATLPAGRDDTCARGSGMRPGSHRGQLWELPGGACSSPLCLPSCLTLLAPGTAGHHQYVPGPTEAPATCGYVRCRGPPKRETPAALGHPPADRGSIER
jgi:hypothetical protein